MDMTPIQWVLIVLLVLLIAVGVYMLTRKPSSGQGRSEQAGESAASQSVTSHGAGGEHVAAGDAGATPSAPLYDQEVEEAAYESSIQDDPIDAPVWNSDDSLGQDTATGGDLDIVEEEPVVSATEDVESPHADVVHEADHGDREQMAYPDPQAEDFASETVYAEAPVEDYTVVDDTPDVDTYDVGADDVQTVDGEASEVPDAVVVDDNDDVPSDAAAAGFAGAAGATALGGGQASHDGVEATTEATDLGGEGSENTGPEGGEGGADDRDSDQGYPGPDSQPGDEATYVAGAGAMAPSMADAEHTDDDRDSVEDLEASDSDITGDEVAFDDGEVEHGEIEIVEPEVAFADGSQPDDVPVVFEAEDDQREDSVDEVADYGTHEAVQPDHHAEATGADEHDSDEDHAEPVEDTDETVATDEDTDETDTTGDDQPQVAMVDVNDYGTHEAVQPDHHAEANGAEDDQREDSVDEDVEHVEFGGTPAEGEGPSVVSDDEVADHEVADAAAQPDHEAEATGAEEHDSDEDTYATVATDEDHAEPVEDSDTTGDDQPQVVMVDVNDYGTHEAVQPDHHAEANGAEDDQREDSVDEDVEHVEFGGTSAEDDGPSVVVSDDEVADHEVADEDTTHNIDAPDTNEDTYVPVAPDEDQAEPVEQAAPEDVQQDDDVAEDTAYGRVIGEDEPSDTGENQSFDEPAEEAAEETHPLIEASPYGVGSAMPGDDGNGPEGYEIKGNAGSMLFHTPESPSYEECTPEVLFENEDAARAAGFAHWDRKRR